MHIGMAAWAICKGKGGSERMAALLATEMVGRGHKVTFFHRYPECDRPVFELPKAVNLVGLNTNRLHLARSAAIVRACDPDLFFVFAGGADLPHGPSLLKGSGIPCLIGLHHNPASIMSYALPEYEYFGALATADFIHAITPEQRDQLPPALQERVEIIANCAPPVRSRKKPPGAGQGRIVLGLGRFDEYSKRFSLLLQAFALLAPRFPDWKLVLCGDGEDRDRYRSFIMAANLEGRVILPGMVDDVDACYAAADIFCIPSTFEAQPMALLEAAAHALPLVGFAACPGVKSLIKHGQNGLLAPEESAESLAAVLADLMADEGQRAALGQKAAAGLQNHEPQKTFDRLEELMRRCATRKGATRLDSLGLNAWTEEALNRTALDILRPDYIRLPRPGCQPVFIDEREDMTRAETRAMRLYVFFAGLPGRLRSLLRRISGSAAAGGPDCVSSPILMAWDYSLRKERLLTPGQQWALWFFRMPKWLGRYATRRLPPLWRRFVADFHKYATPPGWFFRPLPPLPESLPENEKDGPSSNCEKPK